MSYFYPPIVPDVMPAFIRTGDKDQYAFIFDLPETVTIEQIKYVQISIVNLKTNRSVLNQHTGIISFNNGLISNIDDVTDNVLLSNEAAPFYGNISTYLQQYKYCVKLNKSQIQGGQFLQNQFYKVQFRFIYKDDSGHSNLPQTFSEYNKRVLKIEKGNEAYTHFMMNYFYEYQKYFSEWSKVCVVRGISQPKFFINHIYEIDRKTDNSSENTQPLATTTLTYNISDIVGQMYFDDTSELQGLKSYHIKIYPTNEPNNVIDDSGWIYNKSLNSKDFNYQIPYNLQQAVQYTVEFDYYTTNLYSPKNPLKIKFIIIEQGIVALPVNISATTDIQNGLVAFNIVSQVGSEPYKGFFTIRRTSSESNFHKWQDVHNAYINDELIDYTFYDKTIQSGVWYKYCVQKRDEKLRRGVVTQLVNPVICILDDIFLTTNDRQLKIQFNPSLSEFKYNVTQSQQITLGSKYPFIKRNGANYFRSFPIGGLISSLVDRTDWWDPHYENGQFVNNKDEVGMFTTKNQIYSNNASRYATYNETHNIEYYDDYVYEKKFRDKVYDFLYDNNAKLFRSTTQGNILIKLLNVDFQPVQSLGRQLYSFTANAVQIDQCNLTNFDKYNIQSIKQLEELFQEEQIDTYQKIGQLYNITVKENDNIVEKIQNYIQHDCLNNYRNKVISLDYFKIHVDFTNDMAKEGYKFRLGYNDGNSTSFYFTPNTRNDNTFQLRNIDINRLLYLSGRDNKTDQSIQLTIDYVATITQVPDSSTLIESYTYKKNIGQIAGVFKPDTGTRPQGGNYSNQDSLLDILNDKYYVMGVQGIQNNKRFYQKLYDLFNVQIQGIDGTVAYISDKNDIRQNSTRRYDQYTLYDGYLQLADDNISIYDIKFGGVRLNKRQNPPSIHPTYIGLKTYSGDPPVWDGSKQQGTSRVPGFPQPQGTSNFNDGDWYKIEIPESPQSDTAYFLNLFREVVICETQNISENYNTLYIITGTDDYSKEYDELDDIHNKLRAAYKIEYTQENIPQIIKLIAYDTNSFKGIVFYKGKWFPIVSITNNDSFYQLQDYLYDDDLQNLRENEFYIVSNDGTSNPIPTEPKMNFVYTIDTGTSGETKKVIYYNNKWYDFILDQDENTGVVKCPVDVIINYVYEIEKGVFESQ